MDKCIKQRYYSPGEVIFEEGDDSAIGLFMIYNGSVKITKQQNDKNILLATLGKNAIFGEMALIDQKPRSATATAVTGVQCFIMNAEDFEEKIKELDPIIRGVFRVAVATARTMSNKYASSVAQFPENFESIIVKSVTQRQAENAKKDYLK